MLPRETSRTLKTGTLSPRKIFDACSSGIIATNADGYVVSVNRQAEKILTIPEFDNRDNIGSYICDILPMTGPLVIRCLETGVTTITTHQTGARDDARILWKNTEDRSWQKEICL